MSRPIQVVLVDDHPLFREGVAYVLASAPDIEIIGQGATAADALELARIHQPDVMLLDLDLPGGGLAALSAVAEVSPLTRLAVLTAANDEEIMLTVLRAGALGYILKGIAARDLIAIVRSIAAGDGYVAPTLAAAYLAEMMHNRSKRGAPRDQMSHLTERELQVLDLVATGASNREIAQQLSLTEKTVKYYMTHILQKLNVRNRVEAAMLARDANGAARR